MISPPSCQIGQFDKNYYVKWGLLWMGNVGYRCSPSLLARIATTAMMIAQISAILARADHDNRPKAPPRTTRISAITSPMTPIHAPVTG